MHSNQLITSCDHGLDDCVEFAGKWRWPMDRLKLKGWYRVSQQQQLTSLQQLEYWCFCWRCQGTGM